MDLTPLRDYSNVIEPLPALPESSGRPPDAAPAPSGGTDFASELASRLDQPSSVAQNQVISPYPMLLSRPFVPGGNIGVIERIEDPTEQLMEICKELEGFLLTILLKSMGEGFAKSDLFGKSYESSVYNEMFFYELAESIGTQGPGLGIAQTIFDDIMLKEGTSVDLTA